MEQIFTTIDASLNVTIIPVVNAKTANIAALIYHIFKNKYSKKESADKAVCYPLGGTTSRKNYMGFISFSQPGEIFNYISGPMKLSDGQVDQIVSFLKNTNQLAGLWLF